MAASRDTQRRSKFTVLSVIDRNMTLATLTCVVALAGGAAYGSPISRGNMSAYCRGEVAGMYGTRPYYVKTRQIVKARNGSLSISGTVDKGSEGIKKFKCRFDAKRNFIDVMAMTPDGE